MERALGWQGTASLGCTSWPNPEEGSGAEAGERLPTQGKDMPDRMEPTWIDCQACQHKPHIETSVNLVKEPKPDILLMQEGVKEDTRKMSRQVPKSGEHKWSNIEHITFNIREVSWSLKLCACSQGIGVPIKNTGLQRRHLLLGQQPGLSWLFAELPPNHR